MYHNLHHSGMISWAKVHIPNGPLGVRPASSLCLYHILIFPGWKASLHFPSAAGASSLKRWRSCKEIFTSIISFLLLAILLRPYRYPPEGFLAFGYQFKGRQGRISRAPVLKVKGMDAVGNGNGRGMLLHSLEVVTGISPRGCPSQASFNKEGAAGKSTGFYCHRCYIFAVKIFKAGNSAVPHICNIAGLMVAVFSVLGDLWKTAVHPVSGRRRCRPLHLCRINCRPDMPDIPLALLRGRHWGRRMSFPPGESGRHRLWSQAPGRPGG